MYVSCGSKTAPRQFPAELASRLASVAKEQRGDHAGRADRWPSSSFQTSATDCFWLSGRSAVAAQQPAKWLVGDHLTITTRRLFATMPDTPVAEPLVRSLDAAVGGELLNRPVQVRCPPPRSSLRP
jgi:hypothetical protein